jgi:hypothetical protein
MISGIVKHSIATVVDHWVKGIQVGLFVVVVLVVVDSMRKWGFWNVLGFGALVSFTWCSFFYITALGVYHFSKWLPRVLAWARRDDRTARNGDAPDGY